MSQAKQKTSECALLSGGTWSLLALPGPCPSICALSGAPPAPCCHAPGQAAPGLGAAAPSLPRASEQQLSTGTPVLRMWLRVPRSTVQPLPRPPWCQSLVLILSLAFEGLPQGLRCVCSQRAGPWLGQLWAWCGGTMLLRGAWRCHVWRCHCHTACATATKHKLLK